MLIKRDGLHHQTRKLAEQLEGGRTGEQAQSFADGGPDRLAPSLVDRRRAVAKFCQI